MTMQYPRRLVGELFKQLSRTQPRRPFSLYWRPPRPTKPLPPQSRSIKIEPLSRPRQRNNDGSSSGRGPKHGPLMAGVAGASFLAAVVAILDPLSSQSNGDGSDARQGSNPPSDGRDPSLPRHRLADIRAKHGQGSDEPWVTCGDKVYDITDWVGAHPGGEVILRAAGGSIEPYWNIFTIHKAPHVREILDQYLIGLVAAEDLDPRTGLPTAEAIEDPFAADPARDTRLRKHTAKPCNAEPPAEVIAHEFVTPPELFYVRNHMWVPQVDAADGHALTIELPDGEERVYTLAELRSKFRPHRITASLQCSGNRRSDMTASAAATNGLQWGAGAISNAEWEGVRLSDVLRNAGLAASLKKDDGTETDEREMHVQFSALEAYGASIPLSTALDPRADVLLAFKMNGAPLPRDHGFPLRTIVPGHVAARSVKWLNKIVVSDEESPSQWQRRDYKCFGPNEGSTPDWDRYPAIQEMPVTSAVTGVWVGDCIRKAAAAATAAAAPASTTTTSWMLRRTDAHRAAPCVRDLPGWRREHMQALEECHDKDKKGPSSDSVPVALTGYAYSGGGKRIIRVDVSVDGGRTWDQAELVDDCGPDGKMCAGSKSWSWKRWRYVGSLGPEFVSPSSSFSSDQADAKGSSSSMSNGKDAKETTEKNKCTTILVKATDSAYNTQPEQHTGIYNVRGNLATAWHRVRVCPSCVKSKDGSLSWQTGDGVFGSGFRALSSKSEEGKKDQGHNQNQAKENEKEKQPA